MSDIFSQAFSRFEDIVLDRRKHLRWAVLCVLCRGNLLIEDFPGIGKTTLVYLISKILGKKLTRIQFTNDLLPSDILGCMVFDKNKNEFYFRKGPIFGQMILADELNRGNPKTQSALLQCMEEKQVSIEGHDHRLNSDHCIIATQNPYDHVGTFNLPESQVDRFFMAMTLGKPSRESEKKIIQTPDMKKLIDEMDTSSKGEEFQDFWKSIETVSTTEPLLNYALDILDYLRKIEQTKGHISPRAGRDLITAAKGQAHMEGRTFVIPEDIKFVAPAVFAHRLGLYKGVAHGKTLVEEALDEVAIP